MNYECKSCKPEACTSCR